jgi:hypothetical protein
MENDNNNDNSPDDSEISEHESRLLQAFVDSELTESEMTDVRRMLTVSPRLKREYEFLLFTKHELGGALQLMSESRPSLDIWSKIEPRLLAESNAKFNLLRFVEGFAEYIRSPGPSRGAFAAVCLAFIAVVGSNLKFGSTVPESPAPSLAANDSAGNRPNSFPSQLVSASQVPVLGRGRNDEQLLPVHNVALGNSGFAGSANDLSGRQLELNNSPLDARRSGLSFSLSLRRVPRNGGLNRNYLPLNERNFLRSGMSTKGAEIDFIKGAGPIRVFPVREEKAPPVIWVASSAQR